MAALHLLMLCPLIQSSELDSSWSISVGGQVATANPDGTFTVPNVPAADLFGELGPGSPPDFVSDDHVQVVGSNISSLGEPQWIFSEGFLFANGATVQLELENFTFTTVPPPLPGSLTVRPVDGVGILATLGATLQLETLATVNGGDILDVTEHIAWTSYRTSNPDIVRVNENGLVTATGDGAAFITATNTGAAAATLIQVIGRGRTNNVEGICRVNGLPQADVNVSVLGLALSTATNSDGSFSFSNVPTTADSPLQVIAVSAIDSVPFVGVSEAIYPEPGLIVDAGLIDLQSQEGLTNAGFESGDFTGYTTDGNAIVTMQEGFVVAPEGTQMARIATGPAGNGGTFFTQELLPPPGTEAIALEVNFLTDELDNAPAFDDTLVVTINPSVGPATEVLRVTVADIRNGELPSLEAPEGFDAMTGFISHSFPLEGIVSPEQSFSLAVTVFDVGDGAGNSVALADLLRWE